MIGGWKTGHGLPSRYVSNMKIRHVRMDLPRHPCQLSCYFILHVVTWVYYLQRLQEWYRVFRNMARVVDARGLGFEHGQF